MRHKKDPRQTPLFDPFAPVFSETGYERIRTGWWEVFRRCVLELLPVDVLEKEFDPALGRPTKELYSVAGLLLVKEFNDWREEEAVDAYMFHAAIQYALNLEPAKQSLSVRTLQRYERIFRENDLAARIMHDVTARLVEELELDVSRQRLDSTHIESNMATFGRTRLMGVAIKRFLTQVTRHDRTEYEALPEEIRARYEPSAGRMFGDVDKDGRTKLRQQVAEDLLWLIEHFADNPRFNDRKTYKDMVQIFDQQCEVEAGVVIVKKKTGGAVIQNPSDPDATYDGKKGPGYQVQICETCSEENEEQLITSARLETAVESDQNALVPILEDLEGNGLLPDRLDADAGYGSDDNVCQAAEKDVDLQSPVAGHRPADADKDNDVYALNVDDFAIDPDTETVECCPAGHKPLLSVHDPQTGITTTTMPAEACAGCEFGAECPIKKVARAFRMQHSAKQRRLAERLREQATVPFREHYRMRSGGESVNSGLKRRTGFGRLRVRGRRAVSHAVYLRIAGWNILRAAASSKMQAMLRVRETTRSADSPATAQSGAPSGACMPWIACVGGWALGLRYAAKAA